MNHLENVISTNWQDDENTNGARSEAINENMFTFIRLADGFTRSELQ